LEVSLPDVDTFLIYLAAMNALSFAMLALYYRSRARLGGEVAGSIAPGALSAAGGGVGVLLALALWGGKVRKDNVGPRVFAVGALVLWGVVVANVCGWHRFSVEALRLALGREHFSLAVYLGVVNVVTFVLFCVDKARAVRHAWRVPEGVLLGLSLAGGSVGGMLAMAVCRHKVSVPRFRFGLPAMLVADVVVIAYLMQAGVV
jgi:uncharacterized membrane protein YsdA (DUF1294 family)